MLNAGFNLLREGDGVKNLFTSLEDRKNIVKKYLEIIKNNNFKSNNILMLVDNNVIRLNYIRQMNLDLSEELKICTYSQFVREEITKYWPIISGVCKDIVNKSLSPIFISTNLKTYIFETKVADNRNQKNYFADITGTNRSIASNIVNNLDHAIYNDIDYRTIGEKIYNSKSNKDNIDRFSYSQMDEIIGEYMQEMLKNSMVDNSISVYLYNNYLLKDELYLKQLVQRYDYLFVDDLQNIGASQVSLIDFFDKRDKEIYLYLDGNKYFSSFIKNDLKYVCDNLLEEDQYYSNVGIFDLINMPVKIELDQSSQLYSEMIVRIIDKVKELVGKGVSMGDICIITPVNTPVLDYDISTELEKSKIEVLSTKKDSKIIDYPYGNLLYVAVAIFCKLQNHVKEEEFINFIQILFDVNRIKSCKIYKNRDKDESYIEIIKYIEEKRDENLSIGEFLIKFYIDKVLNLKEGRKNVSICKNIVSESEAFTECLDKLDLKDNKSKEEIFLTSLKRFIKDYFVARDIEDIKSQDKVLISTPFSYIYNRINRKVQIWVDIGSNAWNMKIERDLSNPIVLKKSFEEGKVYTSEIEDDYKKYYLYNTVYNLLKSCERVYAYKSDYSINGYIQESGLYSLVLRLIDKGDEDFE